MGVSLNLMQVFIKGCGQLRNPYSRMLQYGLPLTLNSYVLIQKTPIERGAGKSDL